MARGDKSSYSSKQKRKAEHIEESERDRGVSEETAERIAWATVNKQDGGAKKSSGTAKKSAKKGARKSTAKKAASKTGARKTAAKKSTARTSTANFSNDTATT